MSELTTGGIIFESPFAYRIDKEAVEEHNKAIRKSFEKAFAVAELEKLKAEIRTIPQVHIKTGAMSLDKELVVPLNKVIEELDKHIAELKGYKYEPDDWDSLANAERDH